MENTKQSQLKRFTGCLLGLAVGDAVGTTLEFSSPGSFEPIANMVGGGPFGLKPGQWTDDTSMALCLAESLIAKDGFNAQDQMERYVRWWRHGHLSSTGRCFDIGITVAGALRAFEATGNAYAGSLAPNTAGNGSLMRLAPVPLYFSHDAEQAIRAAADSSKTTHGTLTCLDACSYFAGLILGALDGKSKTEILSSRFHPRGGAWSLCPEVDEIASGSFKRKAPPAIRGTGYVINSLEAALWAFHVTDDFPECVLAAANLGDDADTTAAIAGQIAGAYYTETGIPSTWLEKLWMAKEIWGMAIQLFQLSRSKAN